MTTMCHYSTNVSSLVLFLAYTSLYSSQILMQLVQSLTRPSLTASVRQCTASGTLEGLL